MSDAAAQRVQEIGENLREVRERVAQACARAGRDSGAVTLIAVSKTKPIEDVKAAIDAGQRDFGENYAQELVEKVDALRAAGGEGSVGPGATTFHFIGALQSNKVKQVVGRAALVHTCDRPSLAQELAKRAASAGIVQRVLIEVNLGGEEQKGGCAIAETGTLLELVRGLPALRCVGLMCIPPAEGDPRPHFRRLRELRDSLPRAGELRELSMGMSADYEVAIEEGATIVRVGTAIFGARMKRA
ncbi:MAG: YggS family pyridoxal phosphate-dependent enzyme [Deltaproteobacteria bacterium]|nr:YggS family pyridoxal phosphate-dependent enzyme [Deltaproteobacteria bacterium]